MAEARAVISIDKHAVSLTAKELYALAALISESHGEICQQIGSCCDMDEATKLSRHLEPMHDACARVMTAASNAMKVDQGKA